MSLLLGLFSLCLVALLNLDRIDFASFYILFCHIQCLSLRNLFSSNETERSIVNGRGKETGNYNQDIIYEKRIYFQQNKILLRLL